MIVFPVSLEQKSTFSSLPLYHEDQNGRLIKFELEKTEEGAITIRRKIQGKCSTNILVPPIGKEIEITHKLEGRIERRYVHETPDHHAIGMLAKHVMSLGFLDAESAKQLSLRIDMEIAACKEKRIGRTVQSGGGWRAELSKIYAEVDRARRATR